MSLRRKIADLLGFLQQIRNLLRIGLTPQDLPDATILEQVFLRDAELEVYDAIDLTDATYDTKAAGDNAFRERTQNAVLYRAAAKMVYSLPEIVSETVLQQSVRYREIDIDSKVNFWLKLADQAIEPDIVDPQYRQGAVIGFELDNNYEILGGDELWRQQYFYEVAQYKLLPQDLLVMRL